MAYVEFMDGRERRWRAWDTYPRAPAASAFSDGWLTFECLSEPFPKRRLSPVPEGWAERGAESLRALLRVSAGQGAPLPARETEAHPPG